MQVLQPFEIDLSGINLVEASAGTGKTYNITSIYIRALIELEIPVGKILVVTYTEAATKELKDRLLKRIRESISVLAKGEASDERDQFLAELLQHTEDRDSAIRKLEGAVRSFDEAAIYTIHGFCYQALQEQAFESRAMYDAEMIGDDSELVLEAVDDYWRDWVSKATDDPSRRPVMKLLTDKGYNPDKLAAMLGPHLGKPYLKVRPEDGSVDFPAERLKEFQQLHQKMQRVWTDERQEIYSLLSADKMSNYRASWLEGWFLKMDDIFSSNSAVIVTFDQFERFTQQRINNSITKKAERQGAEPPEHPFFAMADRYLELAESFPEFEVLFKKRLYEHLREELREKKEDLQVLSYDDLLLRLREALTESERAESLAAKLRTKYPLALVDEFQDTDPNQYDIFRRIYSDNRTSALFMIGDPKQSIYSFRGADVFSYIKAKQDAPSQNTYGLNRNFRSVPKLLDGINTLFEAHQNPFLLDEISYEAVRPGREEEEYPVFRENGEERPPIRFRKLSMDGEEQLNKGRAVEKAAEDTANEIYRLIEKGKRDEAHVGETAVRPRDIAVLVRTHRQAAQISESLRERGIKSVQYSQESVFQSEEASQLEKLLQAVAEPANEARVKTALALPLSGYTAEELLHIEEDEEQWIRILNQFADWHRKWQDRGFAAMFRSLLNQAGIPEHIMNFSNGERRLTNILHLGELLQSEARKQKEGSRGLLKWLARKRREDSDARQDEEQLRLESDRELVKVVTMHRSKGLEYPIVFCPFLWHGPHYADNGQPLVYHDEEEMEQHYLDLGSKSDPERDRKRYLVAREELAESMRLAYVAITRAEQCCYLSWAYATQSELSPLGYLLLGHDTALEMLENTFAESYEALGSDTMEKAMETLCESHPGLFDCGRKKAGKSDDHQLELLGIDETVSLERRKFERSLPLQPSYAISSFSSLTTYMEEDPDMPDYEQFLETDVVAPEEDEKQKQTMFTFPKGPQPGTCLHNIFEDVDFASPELTDEFLEAHLEAYGIGRQWVPVVRKMMHRVLEKSLHPEVADLSLSALQRNDVVPEMEFYFRNGQLNAGELLSIIRSERAAYTEQYLEANSGFLKGFIDLTFCYEGRYYLLDYKSNYLGGSLADYEQQELQREIHEASYDLQYHIYTVALHRFLENKLPDYSYDTHFGGAFYLFLRGINEEGREGIFFDRPSFATVKKLNDYIREGEDG